MAGLMDTVGGWWSAVIGAPADVRATLSDFKARCDAFAAEYAALKSITPPPALRAEYNQLLSQGAGIGNTIASITSKLMGSVGVAGLEGLGALPLAWGAIVASVSAAVASMTYFITRSRDLRARIAAGYPTAEHENSAGSIAIGRGLGLVGWGLVGLAVLGFLASVKKNAR